MIISSLKKIPELFVFLSVLVMILFSKTVYFGIINRSVMQYFFYGIILIGFMLNYKKRMRTDRVTLFSLAIFIFLFAFNLLIHYSDMEQYQINSIAGHALTFSVIFIATRFISKQAFAKWYVLIILVLSLISLYCVFIANIDQELAYSFTQAGYSRADRYGYSMFYTWGWNGVIFTRNAGPFWEPGAFQGFITLALMMLLYNKQLYQFKYQKIIFVILMITMISTRSTTGYIVLALLLLSHAKLVLELFEIKKVNAKLILILIILGLILFIIFSGNIQQKLFVDATESTSIRSNDILGGLTLSFNSGLFGLGETGNQVLQKELNGINVADSCGITAMTYTYGILFGAFYVYSFLKSAKSWFKNRSFIVTTFTIGIFVILHMTEGLWFLAVYLFVLFSGLIPQKNTSSLKSTDLESSKIALESVNTEL